MAQTVAIICEYNPFHNGHKYQIDKIREQMPDARIACIMSGNVTQRGEFAIMNKYSRAKTAVLSGANMVFEMPFPYSASNAEMFALAGVKIAEQIGADYLCFGMESDKIDDLKEVAEAIDSEQFETEIKTFLKDKNGSYILAKEKALAKLGKTLPSRSNDMLAIEYLRAIKAIGSRIIPLPIKRQGNGYNDLKISDMMSASGIREHFYSVESFVSIPNDVIKVYLDEYENGAVLDREEAMRFLYMSVLRSNAEDISKAFDCPDGCGYFIYEVAKNSENALCFFENLVSKSYTYARLRRIVMNFVFNVQNVEREFGFVNLLCADKIGRTLLKDIKKTEKIKVITKHADVKVLNEAQMQIYNLGKRVDEVFYALLKKPQAPINAYKKNAIII